MLFYLICFWKMNAIEYINICKGKMMKKLLLLTVLATTLILANSAGDKAKEKTKDGAKSAVGMDDKGYVEKKVNKAERKAKKKVIKTAI